jgi:HD-GYP domain-containing protein (c-di-GMP phosphodiesterase class II)
MLSNRDKLMVNAVEYERFQRAYQKKLNELVHGNCTLGSIANTRLTDMGAVVAKEKVVASRADQAAGVTKETSRPSPRHATAVVTGSRGAGTTMRVGDMPSSDDEWLDLQEQAHAMLLGSNPATFLDRLETLQKRLSRCTRQNADGILLALITLSASVHDRYSGTHAMLVSVICELAARDVLNWPEKEVTVLCHAALTMNISMTTQQDRLAQQKEAPTPRQLHTIKNHAIHSVEMLQELGVTHPDLLAAVRNHHTGLPGAMGTRDLGQRAARLIQRADIFAAAISPRASRAAATTSRAMKAAYFDENSQVDEAGAALVKAVGIYPPGSFVRLTSGEVAVVVRRGSNTSAPRVAVVLNRSGLPNAELSLRETSRADWRVTGGVPALEVKVNISLARLLPLTRLPESRFEV